MLINRLFCLLMVTGLMLAACAPQAAPTAALAATATALPPTATAVPPTATALPPTATAIPPTVTAGPPTQTPIPTWRLVVVGDSVPYNSPDDCPGCTGYADRYAAAFSEASGLPVKVLNLSEHNGLQTDGLLEELKSDSARRKALANADIIIVSIGANDTPWNRDDDPCDGASMVMDWSKFTPTCAAAAAEIFRPKLESIFAQVVALRAGKPTIFLTTNGYNDWIGGIDSATGIETPPEGIKPSRDVIDAWSAMTCKAAEANGFRCADTYHAFNGPDGLKAIVGDLTASKANGHLSDKGNEVFAQVLADLGYAPLVP